MSLQQQVSDTKIHARWESEHGHWLKDLRIWDDQHQIVQEAVTKINATLDQYQRLVKDHHQRISQHREVLKLEEDALAYRREHPSSASKAGELGIEEFEGQAHEIEKKNHSDLQMLHVQVHSHIKELVDRLHLAN